MEHVSCYAAEIRCRCSFGEILGAVLSEPITFTKARGAATDEIPEEEILHQYLVRERL